MSQTKPLKELLPGQKGKVVKVSTIDSVYRRILDMGIVKGVEIEMVRVAPLGDPISVKVKGYHLSLRKDEAANILVSID